MSIEGLSKLRLLKPLRVSNDLILLELPSDYVIVSNALGFEGMATRRYVVFLRVSNEDVVGSPIEILAKASEKSGVGVEEALFLLTSANLEKSVFVEFVDNPVRMEIVMSASFDNPACIDMENGYRPLGASTINILVLVDEGLSPSGLLDMFKLVAEVKSIAVSSLLLRCKSNPLGTTTDVIAVGARRGRAQCVGLLTDVGNALAKTLRGVIVDAYKRMRNISTALRDAIGLSLDQIVELAVKVYREAPLPNVPEDEARRELMEILKELLSDPNVWSFIIASRELDNHGYMGTLWRLTREEFLADSARIVADEILGMALSSYAHGSRAIFAMFWVESLKKRGLIREVSELPMFEDDIASALIASALSIMYSRYFREVGHEL